MQVRGQYLQPDGTPHQGFITLTPLPTVIQATAGGVPVTMTAQTCRLDMDAEGYVQGELLNPNDPAIQPGIGTQGATWPYCVRENFQRGPVLGWCLMVPAGLGDGDFLDLAKAERIGEEVVRPGDWFPHHLCDTSVQAGRISPRNGTLMRHI